MKLRLALAAATCLVLPLAASAQPVTGPYVDLGLGTTIIQAEKVDGAAVQTRPDYAGVAGVGYGFGNGFRVQLEGNFRRNNTTKIDYAGLSAPLSGGINTYGMFANGFYDIPVDFPVTPYVGAGVGFQWQKLESAHTGTTVFKGTSSSFAYDLIAGAAYNIPQVPGLAVTAEYRFTQLTANRTYYVASSGYQHIYAGPESSHTLLLGLRYQLFNAPAPVAAPAPAPAPVAAPAPAPAKTYLVFFDWDKAVLTPRATQIIAEAASDSKTQNVTTLDVSGYTDTSGTAVYNQGLSERRAKAVAGQLVTDGVPASDIEIHAYGETHLLVPTGPNVREPQNRRVEIVLH
ncbi:OmpA family protein [Acidocella sp.]|uniref:OmpA family protein n=1 Tax=Acidocella sp. TaxID=50710 RepID=UPI00262C5883|nr:OmpA family protein [Acidocella sp.]